MNTTSIPSLVEPLESRIAPAALLPGGKVVTFTDLDGDLVTVKFSKPVLTPANVASIITFSGSMFGASGPQQLNDIDVDDLGASANGVNITVMAKRAANGAGNGEVTFHSLNASNVNTTNGTGAGIDVGTVKIGGHVTFIDVGDADVTTPAAKSISVLSIGQSQHGVTSVIHGAVGKFTVRGAMYGNLVAKSGVANTQQQTRIGALTVGSLIGSEFDNSGKLDVGDVGKLTVGGSVTGGGGTGSGFISAGTVDSLTIKGALHGSGADNSGKVTATFLKKASINSIVGGDGTGSGAVLASGSLIKVIGSIVGGKGDTSGLISGAGLSVTVGGSVIGAAGQNSGSISGNGGKLGTVTIAGSLEGGSDDFTGRIEGTSIDKVFVGGDVVGGGGDFSGTIAGSGGLRMVKGSVLGGPSSGSNPSKAAGIYADADTISRIVIGGDVVDANIVVGVKATTTQFGDGDDADLNAMNVGRIGALIVRGHVGSGTIGPAFGIEANAIGSVSIGGLSFVDGVGGVNFAQGFLTDPSGTVKVRVV